MKTAQILRADRHNHLDCGLDWSNLKAFQDDKIELTQKLKFSLGKEENILGKGENAGY